MSVMLANCGIVQCMRFYAIGEEEAWIKIAEDRDILIRSKKQVTLVIPNGNIVHVRDIVVFGKLIIQSENIDNTAVKANLIARDIIAPVGHIEINNVDVAARYLYETENEMQLKQELQEIITDWFAYQRMWVNKIGLRSILV